MRLFISILIFITYFQGSFCQIKIDTELGLKLEGKTKFQDIKMTVWSHLNEKLAALDTRDSVGQKAIFRQMKKWNREFWINEYYTDADGKNISAGDLNINGLNQMKREVSKKGVRNQSQDWILQGPTLSDDAQGRVDRIALHPSDPQIMFAGSPHGGLFKTTDGGSNWFPLGDFLPSLGVAGIAVNPNNPDIIFILTGEGNNSCIRCGFKGDAALDSLGFRSSASQGVFKSTDGGLTWVKTNPFPALVQNKYNARDLIIDPLFPDRLLVTTDKGIYKTMDGGQNWTQKQAGDFWDIKFKPGDHNTVYATSSSAFWKSDNNGDMWNQIAISGISASTRNSIAVTPSNPNRVALLSGKDVSGAGDFIGIFVSDDSGMNFINRYSDNASSLFNCYNPLEDKLGSQINYNNTIAISPINHDVFVVGGLCIWSSDDGGFNWNQETLYGSSYPGGEYIHPDQHHLVYHPNGTLYVGNDGGIYKSTDDGDDWEFISNGLTITQFYHFERENDEETGDHEGYIWGGTQDNGTLQQVWPSGEYEEYSGGDGYDVMTDRSTLVLNGNQDDIYYTQNAKVYADCSPGDCDITPPMNEIKKEFFGNLAMSPEDEDVIFAGYESFVYYSENRGSDWENIDVRGNWCISTCQSNADILYAAGTAQITRTSLSDFANPVNLTSTLQAAGWVPTLKISDIEVHTLNESEVYVSIAGSKANAKIFRTLDDGMTWQNWTFNLPNVPIFCIKLDGGGGLYAGTSVGVFYKQNNVNYWEPFSNGLPPVPVTEIELWPVVNPLNPPSHSPPTPEIWISTFGRGIWFTQQYNFDCPPELTLSGTPQGTQYHVATNQITSTQKVTRLGAKILYNINPGGQIRLLPGFNASTNNGAKFKAFTSGCGGQLDLSKPANPKKENKKLRASKASEELKK